MDSLSPILHHDSMSTRTVLRWKYKLSHFFKLKHLLILYCLSHHSNFVVAFSDMKLSRLWIAKTRIIKLQSSQLMALRTLSSWSFSIASWLPKPWINKEIKVEIFHEFGVCMLQNIFAIFSFLPKIQKQSFLLACRKTKWAARLSPLCCHDT